jgi:hypothetical protein
MIRDHLDLAAARAERKRLKREYSGLFEDLSALLYRIDPMGINFEVNPDEYDAEVGTILPRVLQLETAGEIQRVIREEFVRWFGTCPIEAATYEELAMETLEVLSRYRLR